MRGDWGVSLVVGTLFEFLGMQCCSLALRCLGCQIGVKGGNIYMIRGSCCVIGENMRASD